MENFTPISALLGGVMIGISAIMLLAFNGRIAGISGIFGSLFKSSEANKVGPLLFIVGLIVGAAIFQNLASEPTAVDRNPFNLSGTWQYVLLIAGGLLVGFGTQLGNGCTSGHGVCGIARFSVRSLIATVTFIATAALSVIVVTSLTGV